MAKDVLRAMAREQRAVEERDESVEIEIEVVVDGYRRHRPLKPSERQKLDEQRRALRERLYAAG